MSQKEITVSVGICAFNEGKNIQNILRDVVGQKQAGWKLAQIIVYSDNSTDDTVSRARSVRSRKIKVIDGRGRKGKSGGLKTIFKRFTGNYLAIFDADLKLKDENVITEMVKIAKSNKNIAMVGANTRPFNPKTFFEKTVFSTFLVFSESRMLRGGQNPFSCNGGGLLVRRDLTKLAQKVDKVLNEDDYLYFTCLKNGLNTNYAHKAVVYYKLPKTLPDYLKQSFRSNPQAIEINFSKIFGEMVRKEYYRPPVFYLNSILKSFKRYPLNTIFAILINIAILPFYKKISGAYKLEWYTAESTK